MAHDGQRPGDRQEAAENRPQILYDYVFGSEIRERKTPRVGAEIQAERKDHLNDAGTGFRKLKNSPQKKKRKTKAQKERVWEEFEGKNLGEGRTGLGTTTKGNGV